MGRQKIDRENLTTLTVEDLNVGPAVCRDLVTGEKRPVVTIELQTEDGDLVGFTLEMEAAGALAMSLPEVIEAAWARHDDRQ